MKKINLTRVLYYFVLLSFLIPIIYLIYRISTVAPGVVGEGMKSRADYVLMLVQCALGILVIHLPSFLAKKLKFEIPTALYIMYIIFLYCAIFLGEVRSFYYNVPHWDDILHFLEVSNYFHRITYYKYQQFLHHYNLLQILHLVILINH